MEDLDETTSGRKSMMTMERDFEHDTIVSLMDEKQHSFVRSTIGQRAGYKETFVKKI